MAPEERRVEAHGELEGALTSDFRVLAHHARLDQLRVGVQVEGFFSAEDTLELCRQLRSREIEFIAIAPLEWSTVRTMDLLQAMAIEVVVRHSFLDSEPINLPLLERICADVDAPIWIHGCGVGFDDSVLQALHQCGCRGIVTGETA